jgi:hypothetical protein
MDVAVLSSSNHNWIFAWLTASICDFNALNDHPAFLIVSFDSVFNIVFTFTISASLLAKAVITLDNADFKANSHAVHTNDLTIPHIFCKAHQAVLVCPVILSNSFLIFQNSLLALSCA